MKKLILAAALVAGTSAAASAADLPVKAPVLAPAPVLSWTGFYLGAHIGYGWGESDVDTSLLPSPALFGAAPFNQGHDADGFVGGLQLGYNWQVGPSWLWGVEADVSWTDINGSSSVGPLPLFGGGFDPGSSQLVTTDLNWFATLRLRAGFLVSPALLVYATGGLAVGDVEQTAITDYVGPAFLYPGSTSETRTGWTAGAGLEWAFAPRWSAKIEWLYYDLGDQTIVANPVAPNPPFQVSTNHDLTGNIARFGINYKFTP